MIREPTCNHVSASIIRVTDFDVSTARRTADPATIDPFLMAEEPPDPARRAVDTSKSVTLMIDAETWLQVGSRITNPDGQLVGEYYFRDVELNPKFAPDQFKPSAFRK